MSENNYMAMLDSVIKEVGKALLPIEELDSPERVEQLLRDLGWEIPGSTPFSKAIQSARLLGSAIQDLEEMFKDESDIDMSSMMETTTKIAGGIAGIVSSISEAKDAISRTLNPAPTNFDQLPQRLLDYMIITYLQRQHQKIYSVLVLVGLIRNASQDPNPIQLQPKFILREVMWDRFSMLFDNPLSLPNKIYGWGNANFDANALLSNVFLLMKSFQFPGGLYNLNPAVLKALGYNALPTGTLPSKEINIPIFQSGLWPDYYTEGGVNIFAVPPSDPSKGQGIAAMPYFRGNGKLVIDLGDVWQIELTGKFDSKNGYALVLKPSEGLAIKTNMYGSAVPGEGSVEAKFGPKPAADLERVLFGSKTSTYVGIKGFSVKLIVEKTAQDYDIALEACIESISITLSGGDGDGFLQKILPDPPINISFGLGIGFSKKRGFFVKDGGKGGAKIEYTYHANLSFGPFSITTLNFILAIESGSISLVVAATAKAEIGPASGVVEKMGLKLMLELGKKGLLGNADLGLGFKPPSGVGLSLQTSTVTGGGYLSIEDGNYAGILQLEIKGMVSICVIGILTTKLPDGTKIFSLKVFGTAKFSPIQLGFGFVLTGLGFAAGIACSMNTEALRQAVYTKSLDAILFPADPVKNAPKIIADLKAFFPEKDGCYVFGAMAQLGWGGAKALIKAEIGIFLEFGDGLRIALAGIAHAELPNEDSIVLSLRLTVLGILDIKEKTLSIDSTLEGSKLITWPLNGDIALRACWGDNPLFAFSAGGFFPGYRVPKGFPELRRLSITLGENNPKIGFFLYTAVTENSVQFGAQLLFYFKKKICWPVGLIEVVGELKFDALFKFSPFYFEVKMSATLSLKRNGDFLFGVWLSLNLSGPNNYHAAGYAKFSILGIDISADFDETFGDKLPEPTPPPISAKDMLLNELEQSKNWAVLSPNEGSSRVILRMDNGAGDYVDTFGGFGFRQKSVPLCFHLEKLGEAPVKAGENIFDIIASGASENLEDFFAPGHFEYLTDQEKISKPAFESMKSGVSISTRDIGIMKKDGWAVQYGKELKYETKKMASRKKRQQEEEKPKPIDVQGHVVYGYVEKFHIAAGHKYHNPTNIKPEEDKKNRISVLEPTYTVITSNVSNGKFQRVETEAGKSGNVTYAEARYIKETSGREVEIVVSTKAEAV